MGVKVTRRGVIFGAEGNLSLRSDYSEIEITDGVVEFAGTPVPVVFGTRYVDPIVTGWEGLSDFITKFYKPGEPGVTDTVPTRVKRDSEGNIETGPDGEALTEPDPRAVRMTVLTMRWVLCLGASARLGRFYMNNQLINIYRDSLPVAENNSESRRLLAEAEAWVRARTTRFVVAEQAADDFGGGDSGGVGYPWGRLRYSGDSQLSEFWLCNGYPGQPTNEVIDRGSPCKNVISLFFHNFNFGGKRPIPKARVAVQRLWYQTTLGDDGRPVEQWQTDDNLHIVSELKPPDANPYYLIVLDSTLDKTAREKVRDYLLTLPYDESGTQYHIIRASYYTTPSNRVAEVVESVINEDGDREQTQRNLLKDRLDSYVNAAGSTSPARRATSFDLTLARRIASTYADHMYSVHNRRESRQGVIALFLTDMFVINNGIRSTLESSLRSTLGPLWLLKYPNSVTAGANGAFPTSRQIEGVKRFQPELKLTMFKYLDTSTAVYRYRGVSPSYSETTPTVSGFAAFREWNTPGRDILLGSLYGAYDNDAIATLDEFRSAFQIAATFGWTMNPVHALREALTNPDWGEGVPADKINEADFLSSAKVCKEEGLDYCYVHKQLGGVERVVTGITDYIDAMVWYDPYTDSVRMNLIREDYDINNLPTYDESTIAGIENYRRMNTNELTNSVTVKYHDAALGSNETITIHDLEASFRSGGVISATFNYDGCARLNAAARVADRELVSLSRSIITFTVKLHTGDHVLGLGDPVVISYRDLGIQSVVMRVTRILYGDGTTGGISVDLVQDVFADLKLFGDIVEVEPYLTISEAPPFIRLDAEVAFLEQGYFDLPTALPFDNPQNRWLKAGVRYTPQIDDDAYVSIDEVIQLPSIGELLTDIPPLYSDPRTEVFWIEVRINPEPTPNNYVRIGDEIFKTGTVRKISDDTYRIQLTARAQRDTVATGLGIPFGADVWFLDRLWIDQDIWDGSLVHALFHSGVHNSTELLRPDVDFIGRGNRPQPPEYVSVNRMFGTHFSIDGAFEVRWKPRTDKDAIGQEVQITLTYEDTVIFRQSAGVDIYQGQISEQVAVISLAELNRGVPSGAGILQLEAKTVWQGRDSWQKWNFTIDWSAVARNRCGFGFDFGHNWSGDRCGGWGRDYDEQYGN